MARKKAIAMVLLALAGSAWADEPDTCQDAYDLGRMGDHQGAVAAYSVCLENADLDDRHRAALLVGRAVAHAGLRQYGESVADYDAAAVLDPDDPMVPYGRGKARLMAGERAAAIDDFGVVVDLAPDFPGGYYFRGIAAAENGDLAGAIKDYDRSLELRPDVVEAYERRAQALFGTKQYAAAAADYDRVIEMTGGSLDLFRLRGLARAGAGDADGAFEDLQITWRLEPALIAQDQERLRGAGYYEGEINGAQDEATVAAMRRWLADQAH